ncbi:MAG: hypothetical protein Q9191_006023 [Dirinaria sp. TL-2023a]
MEVLVRNLPQGMTERKVRHFFTPYLEPVGISTYHCHKLAGKTFAKLTFTNTVAGQTFLELHGQKAPGRRGFDKVKAKIYHMRKPVNISQSDHVPDKFLLSSLDSEENKHISAALTQASHGKSTQPSGLLRSFPVRQVLCGHLCYPDQRLAFASYFKEDRIGDMIFGRRAVVVKLKPRDDRIGYAPSHQIEIPYSSVESFTIGTSDDPTATFSLAEAPKLFERIDTQEDEDALLSTFQSLVLHSGQPRSPTPAPKRQRIAALSKTHEVVVSSCLCYRFILQGSGSLRAIRALKGANEIPPIIPWNTPVSLGSSFPAQMTQLNNALSGRKFAAFPFALKFQIQALAQNGYLPPTTVVAFMDVIAARSEGISGATTTKAVRRLLGQIPFAGPETEAAEFSLQTLSEMLVENQRAIAREESYTSAYLALPEHICDVYKAMVTPTGIFLHGPAPEVKNRILRKYSDYTDRFLQVSFLDENGEPMRYERNTSNDEIYHSRFKKVLEGIINIAGRGYEFLGFSHSSLRAQTCYFMAPFTMGHELLHSRAVIARLGEFSEIRSPAKCAARIGQAFSQTFSSVSLPTDAFKVIPDIERNGRVFSDGVGTCSSSVLQSIHDAYGAKGMIALDTRVEGHLLHLRPSMIKFQGSPANDIEICGASFKPLPMYLNRQIIKILEDLGVKESSFLDLQADAVEKLRMTTRNSINAANFLKRQHVGQAARLPWLVRELMDINLSYEDDGFLRNVVELCVLAELREIKHRSRIRVEEGLTLYGIMDETNVIKEGQIYCSVHNDDGPRILTGPVVITRSPALHPGDIQVVEAVDVPKGSSLRALHNCVVFSQQGDRGDLYNIIYDSSLFPLRVAEPADYTIQAPIDIGRVVQRKEITDFFVDFMINDSLGRIATLHLTLADQKERGTFDPDCVLLANLHSTAVDFSKTGIPVDLSKMPRSSFVKPDFQAPGPRVLISNTVQLDKGQRPEDFEAQYEVEELDDIGQPPIRYYKSQKVLGKLYRAIDEQKFFEEIQTQPRRPARSFAAQKSLLDHVWKYVEENTALIQWRHFVDFAQDIKEDYEENLVDTMFEYSTHPPHYISEVEVFSGVIIGKHGAQNKRQRESSVSMKEKHERDVEYTVRSILQGEDNSGTAEALERSIACLWVGCNVVRPRKKVGTLVSFGWVAAAACLKEVEKFRRG